MLDKNYQCVDTKIRIQFFRTKFHLIIKTENSHLLNLIEKIKFIKEQNLW